MLRQVSRKLASLFGLKQGKLYDLP